MKLAGSSVSAGAMFEGSAELSESPSKRPTSIPGRWEAVTTDHAEKKGFGTGSSRFSKGTNDIPGPGAYASDETPLLAKTPSHSQKGYGNAFLSKSDKGFLPPDGESPGPGHYELKGIANVEVKPTSAFIKSGRGRVPFPDPALTKKNIPGPAAYHIKHEYNPPLLVSKSSATFDSKSGRQSFLARDNGVPAAGKYKYDDSELRPIPTFFWSRSTYKRFQDLGMDNKVPGPGAYFDAQKRKKHEQVTLSTNGRTAGVYRNVQWLGKVNDKPVATLHTFGADKDRFKHSFMGRLDLKAEIPGVGAYNLPSFAKKRPKTSAAHIPPFAASGPKILDTEKVGVPGPAYYKPQTPSFKVPSQNLDSHWI